MLPSVDELVDLLSRDASQLTLSGITRELRGTLTWFTVEIHMADGLLRLEEPPGRLDVLLGREHTWSRRTSTDGEVTEVSRAATFGVPRLIDSYPAHPTYWHEWLSQDPQIVTETVSATRLHERDAWKFTSPRVKGRTADVTVDAETGLVLCMEASDLGVVGEWLYLDLEPRHDPELFTFIPAPQP